MHKHLGERGQILQASEDGEQQEAAPARLKLAAAAAEM